MKTDGTDELTDDGEVTRLRERVATLEGLLQVREHVVEMESKRCEGLLGRLRRSEANLGAVVDGLCDAVFVVDASGIRYANPALEALLGYTPGDLYGKSPLDTFVHEDDRATLREYAARRERGEPVTPLRLRWVRRTGEVVVVEASRTAIMFDDQPAFVIFARDVTGSARSADELQASEERYRMLFEGSPLPIILFEISSQQIMAVNESAVALYGYSRAELLSMTMLDLKTEADQKDFARWGYEPPQEKIGTRPWRGTKTHRTKSGSQFELEIVSHAVTVDGKRAMLAIGNDVTERRRLEEQLRRAQKMEAFGQLAGGVAHDFNNLLAVILAATEFAIEGIDEPGGAREDLRDIQAAAARGAALTRQLLTFSRQNKFEPKPLSLDTVVDNLEKMLCRVLGAEIELHTDLDVTAGSIEVDPGQLDQVLVNLVVNARDAMPRGGKLTVQSRGVMVEEPQASLLGITPGPHVVLSVSDTGCGMDAKTRASIFEPFFTTKPVGKGTGLGLATVFGIVKRSGGGIDVTSEIDRGTTFDVYFPRMSAAVVPSAPPKRMDPTRGSESVLVVEDEVSVRNIVARLLRGRGYEVIDACDAQSALAIVAERGRSIQLVVTDLAMPVMDGRTMAGKILEQNPHMKIIYMSGYAEHAALEGAALGASDRFLQKPFTVEEMCSAVRDALDAA